MKGQSEIAYLPKFDNMMLIVMVIVITEILYIILIFDCFAYHQKSHEKDTCGQL